MIVLDTNVIAVLMQPRRPETVMNWLNSHPKESLWTTAITIFELVSGIEQAANAQRRPELQTAFNNAVRAVLQGRILSFDSAAAYESASLFAERKRHGRAVEIRDTQIAGIVRARKATLATRNTRDFADAGIKLIDPWTAGKRKA